MPLFSSLPKGGAKLALSEVQKQQLNGFSSSIEAIFKKRYSWRLGQGVRSMWGKKDFFGEEEATTAGVFASLYLEGTGLLIQLKTTRSGGLRKGQSPCEFLGGLSGFLSR